MQDLYELEDGRRVPVVIEWERHDYSARVVRVDDGEPDEVAGTWGLTWTDGINVWYEEYEFPWYALARLTSLVAAVEQSVFMVHDPLRPGERERFVDEAERFVSRTVHSSSCPPRCDGTNSMNHEV